MRRNCHGHWGASRGHGRSKAPARIHRRLLFVLLVAIPAASGWLYLKPEPAPVLTGRLVYGDGRPVQSCFVMAHHHYGWGDDRCVAETPSVFVPRDGKFLLPAPAQPPENGNWRSGTLSFSIRFQDRPVYAQSIVVARGLSLGNGPLELGDIQLSRQDVVKAWLSVLERERRLQAMDVPGGADAEDIRQTARALHQEHHADVARELALRLEILAGK